MTFNLKFHILRRMQPEISDPDIAVFPINDMRIDSQGAPDVPRKALVHLRQCRRFSYLRNRSKCCRTPRPGRSKFDGDAYHSR